MEQQPPPPPPGNKPPPPAGAMNALPRQAAAQPPPPTQPRPLVQQSNQVVKRLALLGVQHKQLENPELRREVVKEPSITFLAFIVDRLLDHLLTSICHGQDSQLDVETLVQTICGLIEKNGTAAESAFISEDVFLQLADTFQLRGN